MIEPTPPLTGLQLLDTFQLVAPSEIMAQLRIDQADFEERCKLDRVTTWRWKNAYKTQEGTA